ncbi:MAG: hypothetical protein D6692_10230 [Planctomycetota bacterium]|nr:MAG: hypothetical protein D6692_10230 [Planctomycetota bacterium]
MERWIQSLRKECLDQFVPVGLRHLDHLVSEYLIHYDRERPHQSLGNRPLVGHTIRRIPEARSCAALGWLACCGTTSGKRPDFGQGRVFAHRLGASQRPISLSPVLHKTSICQRPSSPSPALNKTYFACTTQITKSKIAIVSILLIAQTQLQSNEPSF